MAKKSTNNNIIVSGARVNNLKNINVEIPRSQLTVITGVSGSGKSSLAFDTLYAEGQRRYVESLSSYARQFLGRMKKPEVDYIKGMPPAIAIEQKVNTRNPRSTVGTATEIYDYLRMLFARIGHTYSPISGREVKKYTTDNIVDEILSLPQGTRIAITAPIILPENRSIKDQLDVYLKEGYSRLVHKNQFIDIDSQTHTKIKKSTLNEYTLLIDRTAVSGDNDEKARITESLETAWFEGHGAAQIIAWTDSQPQTFNYTNRFEADGMEFREPTDLMFNFNNPYGACPKCEGFGMILGIDENLVIPDKSLSIYQDAVQCFRGEKMSEWKRYLIRYAAQYDFPIHTPYADLTPAQLKFLWEGKGPWPGINGFFEFVDRNLYKIQYRVLKAHYRGKTQCPECHGNRLNKDAQYVKINGKSISELTQMPISQLSQFFQNLPLPATEEKIAKRLLTEITSRLQFLQDVGLAYLTLNRPANTLSGGESQRINLATSLGSSLVGSIYILDEPSIGLHPRDTMRLTNVLRHLQRLGNTVVIVEHDEDIMRQADNLIDIGPAAGSLGGKITFAGPVNTIPQSQSQSLTIQYLNGKLQIPYNPIRHPWKKQITITGARQNNLKNITVQFPLEILTVVTGVSGSGKSTLVRDILYKAMLRKLGKPSDNPGTHTSLTGDTSAIQEIEFIDQNPIGTSSRSNPATYLKAYDEIRQLFAAQQLSKQMGYTPAYFSFNTDGGRCEYCKGEGTITIPMQFMADITVECEECHGTRFKPEILDVKYADKNISEILNLTVDEAIQFFTLNNQSPIAARIVRRLRPLQDVGLGYIKLGQSSSTLSGGENQRVKLAWFLAQESPSPTMFIFDEPTTGLHPHDINTLMKSLRRLTDRHHTVIIIEHNLDVIKCADHIIDIGPEGGDQGGQIVATGTPEQIIQNPKSITGKFLAPKLNQK